MYFSKVIMTSQIFKLYKLLLEFLLFFTKKEDFYTKGVDCRFKLQKKSTDRWSKLEKRVNYDEVIMMMMTIMISRQ